MSDRTNYIKKVSGNIIPSIFNGSIYFSQGLNIISGNNGTGKTHLLKYIQDNRTNQSVIEFDRNDSHLKNVAVFDPKRNAVKRAIEQAQRIVRQSSDLTRRNSIQEFLNKQVQDDNIQTIKSISEYLMLAYEEYRDGEDLNPSNAAEKVRTEYNVILQKVFNQYEIDFGWSVSSKSVSFKIKKKNLFLQPNYLSSGENALISLIFAIFYGKDLIQVYLIDEPEIHLNWQLEERLFEFLNWFSNKYKKQLIVVTHSRVCFVDEYLQKTKFLRWNQGNKIEILKYPTKEIINLLAGDFIKIIGGITTKNKLVYVEDKAQEYVLNKISDLLHIDIEIQIIGNSSDVIKFSKLFRNLNIHNVYFLIDNDNKNIKDIYSTINLIQLNKYCIENYFLDEHILSEIDKRNAKQKDIRTLIKEAINQVSQPNFVLIKELINKNVILREDILDRIDASQFIKNLSISLGYSNKEELINAFITKLNEKNQIEDYFREFRIIIA